MQTWHFVGQALLRIGRADDNDVTIPDPRVSRLHAELEFRPAGWNLISRGRNGIYVDGTLIVEQMLTDKRTFQLGSSGPMLRFRDTLQPTHNMTTIDGIDQSLFEKLQIDLKKREEEVTEITGSELFQKLKQRADELRRKNKTGDS